MLETWLQETVLISSADLYRVIIPPFSTLTTPLVVEQVHPPVMLETWRWESRVRLPVLVILETLLQDIEVPPLTIACHSRNMAARNCFDKLS